MIPPAMLAQKIAAQTLLTQESRSLAYRGTLVHELLRTDGVTIAAVARICDVSRPAVYRWMAAADQLGAGLTAAELETINARILTEGLGTP